MLHSRFFRSVRISPRWLVCGWLSVLCVATAGAEESGARSAGRTAADLAGAIDRQLERNWSEAKTVAAPRADDAEFVRRLYLDLLGRIPRVAEVRRFLDDADPDKRTALIDDLLARPAATAHLAENLRAALMPQTRVNPSLYHLGASFEDWLRPRLARGDGYDRIVRDLVTVPLGEQTEAGGLTAAAADRFGAVAWYQIHDLKPENLVAASTRLMLGVRMECAQCHNHPFDKWTKDEFWQTAAFFSRIDLHEKATFDATVPVSIRVPQEDRKVEARILGSPEPTSRIEGDPRIRYAAWLVADDNPFFARATVNRVWGLLFGRGIVHPVDDFRIDNPATHPELLEELTRAFVASGYDLKFLIRSIVLSQAYQRSSATTDPSQQDPVRYARMVERPFTAEQLWDSLTTATGTRDPVPLAHRGLVGLPAKSPRTEFLTAFLGESRAESPQISILHSLKLLHGEYVDRMTSPKTSPVIVALADAPFLSRDEKVETLYLAVFARRPTAEEFSTIGAFLDAPERRADAARGLGDVLWALLNSPEFLLNH